MTCDRLRITISCPWEGPYEKTLSDGTCVSMNQYHPDSAYVVDLACFFTPLAEKYPPHQRVFAAGEPTPYMGLDPHRVAKMGVFYQGLILAWHQALRHLPQTRPFRMGSSWVTWETNPEEKKFGIGGIFSGKVDDRLPGYAVRRKIIGLENSITIPSMVYSPSRQWKGTSFEYPQPSKRPALEYMYHLAVENCIEKGYFTEKIMDCFLTYTIPVYFGDPRIGDAFVPDGIIKLNQNDLVAQINSLTPEFYRSKRDALVENRKRAERYWHFEDNVVSHIRQYRGQQ